MVLHLVLLVAHPRCDLSQGQGCGVDEIEQKNKQTLTECIIIFKPGYKRL